MSPNDATLSVLYATAILSLKMWLCGTITTYVRGHSMQSPNREDEGVMNFFNTAFRVPTATLEVLPSNAESHEPTNRWLRICNNDVANIPIGLFVLYLAAVYSGLDSGLLVTLVWIFVAARLAHTITYAYGIQPWRTVSYSVGATSMILAAISLFWAG
ncbi:MAG: MAPEG family protein [Acidimicrobiales bacterium]